MTQTAVIAIKPIDDRGTIHDDKQHDLTLIWDEEIATNIGCFVVDYVDSFLGSLSEDDDNFTEPPAFDLTLELREQTVHRSEQ